MAYWVTGSEPNKPLVWGSILVWLHLGLHLMSVVATGAEASVFSHVHVFPSLLSSDFSRTLPWTDSGPAAISAATHCSYTAGLLTWWNGRGGEAFYSLLIKISLSVGLSPYSVIFHRIFLSFLFSPGVRQEDSMELELMSCHFPGSDMALVKPFPWRAGLFYGECSELISKWILTSCQKQEGIFLRSLPLEPGRVPRGKAWKCGGPQEFLTLKLAYTQHPKVYQDCPLSSPNRL